MLSRKIAVSLALAGAAGVLAASLDPTLLQSAWAGVARTRFVAAPAPSMLPPLRDWAAPQFIAPPGIAGSMDHALVDGKPTGKGFALPLSTFIPVTPCRLLDTRGTFSPVYAGGPFSAGEVRVYRVPGNCGVPAGNGRVQAVSLAVTTPPTVASGDIEIISNFATLGGTVVMVVQAQQWNSATTLTAVDTNGDFKVQLRSTPGDVVIDINGYYATTSGLQQDFISIVGTRSPNGLLYVQNGDAVGAAANLFNSGSNSQIELASGPYAIDIHGGGIRVLGAGINTTTPAFVYEVDASNLCAADPRYVRIDNPQVFQAAANSAQMLFVTQRITALDPTAPRTVNVQFSSTGTCNGVTAPGWYLFATTAFGIGEQFNVLVINP